MIDMKRFKMHNYNISLHKLKSSFNENEDIIVSFSSCSDFATGILNRTGINKSLLNSYDTSLYDSIFFTNMGLYCLICDLSGKYLTHIFIRYRNLTNISMELFPDSINFSISTSSNHTYNGQLFGDITPNQKELLKSYNFIITDSKLVRFFDNSEIAINKVIKNCKSLKEKVILNIKK